MKSLFVTTVAALALATSGTVASVAAAKPVAGKKHYVVLWNQNSNFGGGVNSQQYESAMQEYDDYAADDFVVPEGQRWFISEVDVTGTYTGGSGPATSVLVIFYHDDNGIPGKIGDGDHDFFTLKCKDDAGSFQCVLPTAHHNKPVVKFGPGIWWVSVSANCDSGTCGHWNWTENTNVTGNQAEWENPGGAWDIRACYGWNVISTCFGGAPADLAFELIGLSQPLK